MTANINIWNAILDGASIFSDYMVGMLVFFVCVFGLGIFVMKLIVGNEFNSGLNLMASFCVGCITLSLVSYTLVLLAQFWPFLLQPMGIVILIFAVLFLLMQFWRHEVKIIIDYWSIIVSVGFILLLLARLAYLKHIILPPYSDSPIHYQIVFEIIDPDTILSSKLSLDNILGNYYHFGFHALTAWLVLVSGLELSVAIPLLGQLFLCVAIISVAALTYELTKNKNAALFSGILSAIGWLMPAFAVNWGKFPALTAIAIMPVLMLLSWLALHGRFKKTSILFYCSVLVIGITLIHTRIIICLFLALIGFFLACRLKFSGELGFFQSFRFSLLFVFSLWPLLHPLLDFYDAIPVWIVLFILLPFAFQSYPTASMGTSFYLLGLSLVMFLPGLVNGNDWELLDRQFLEMILYIPFSVMGGLGFGGLINKLGSNSVLKWSAFIVLAGCVVFNFQRNNSLYPDPCCNYFQEDDRLAFQWIRNNLSEHALFIISTYNTDDKVYGTDAGVWIYPLVKMPTNKMPFSTEWDLLDVYAEICLPGVQTAYIYMGGKRYSFDNLQLTRATWARPAFRSGEVVIYEISECTK